MNINLNSNQYKIIHIKQYVHIALTKWSLISDKQANKIMHIQRFTMIDI